MTEEELDAYEEELAAEEKLLTGTSRWSGLSLAFQRKLLTLARRGLASQEGEVRQYSEAAGQWHRGAGGEPLTPSPDTDTAGLVKRLRTLVIMDEVGSNNQLGKEAADIIERLSAERDYEKRCRDANLKAYHEAKARIAELKRENQRLCDQWPSGDERAAQLQARIAELEKVGAAAPALLAALEGVLLDIDFTIERGLLPDIRNDVIYVAARAAIAQAKGE